eukprot:TRINITY_DN66639_c3_g18_i1.p1 TRINITY_DN66639_c3_g18~~TRINITY_DN66639_c3_g18_i1.p1  ORF type:complete len:868 (-),score=89.49 TRINITY_DN66639_c3_g18_i1:232-2835(-)
MRHHFVLLVLTILVCSTNAKGYYSQNNKQAFKQSRADDLKVCPKCQYDSDCEDGDPCTKNSCFYSEGHGYECRSFPIKDCVSCDSTADCMKDNYDPCTEQACIYGTCQTTGYYPYCGYPTTEKTHSLRATAVNGRAKYSGMSLDTSTSKLFAVASGAVDLEMLPSFVAAWSCAGHGDWEVTPNAGSGRTLSPEGDPHYPNCNPLLFHDLYGLVRHWFDVQSPAEDRQNQRAPGKVKKQAAVSTDHDDGFVIGVWGDRDAGVAPYTIAQALGFIDMLNPSWVDVLDWSANPKFNDRSPEVISRWNPSDGSVVTDVAAKDGVVAIISRPSCATTLAWYGSGGDSPFQTASEGCLHWNGRLQVYDGSTWERLYSESTGVWPIDVEFSDDGHLVVVSQGPGEEEGRILVCDTNWNNPRNEENPRCRSLDFESYDGDSDDEDRHHEMCLGGKGYVQDELYAFDYQRLTPFRQLDASERSAAKDHHGFSARLEPTGVSFTGNNYALVSLTINNGVAVVYLGDRYHDASIEGIVCLGVKNMLEDGNAFDGSDEDGGSYPENWPVFALFQPRKVQAVPSEDGEILFMTANGGAFSVDDVIQVKDVNLDPGRFNIPEREMTPAKLQRDEAIGDLRVIRSQGRWSTGEIFRYNDRDIDEPGADGVPTRSNEPLLHDRAWRIDDDDTFYEKLYMPGARSLSLWKLSLTPLMSLPTVNARQQYAFELSQLWDTGNMFESGMVEHHDELLPLFNAASYFDDQSTGFGPAPSDVVLGEAYGMRVAAVSVTGGNYIALFDIDDVEDPHPKMVITSAGSTDGDDSDETAIFGESGPRKLTFVNAEDSPTGCPQILATNAGAKSIAVYELGLVGMKCGAGKKHD